MIRYSNMNDIEKNVLMSERTSMKVGGPADGFIEPYNEDRLVEILSELYKNGKPYFLLGNGTNVIMRDGGYRGTVVSTQNALLSFKFEGERLICGAGESLTKACKYAAEQSLTGLEELSGIPGTVGGAVYMNAGAYDRDISDVLINVCAYDLMNDKYIMLTKDDCGFAYRTSVFKTKPMIIISCMLELTPGIKSEIDLRMSEFLKRRNEKQPVELPSAGSFFKRPEGDYAGRLIEAAGMKGARVGGAQVSEKHAGFIVNTGGATASDILKLAEEVKAKVLEKFNILLEEEPVIIGD